jgi:PncC family amidohydrolase
MDREERAIEQAARVGELLLELGWTVATAESCTGGLIGYLLTGVSGSSHYYEGGVVSYSDRIKQELLNVSTETLIAHGAVSHAVAREMATGVRKVLGTHVGISVTGIAGPTGGTEAKPLGTTFVGVSTPRGERVDHYVWDQDRQGNKWQSAEAALQMLQEELVIALDQRGEAPPNAAR